MKNKYKIRTLFLYILAFIYAFPVAVTIVKSLQFGNSRLTLSGYWELFVNNFTYFDFFWNSVFYSVVNATICVLVSLPLGFLFAKINIKWKNLIFFIYILVMMLPLQSTILPSYILIRDYDLLNKPIALILPMIFSPLAVFLFRQFIKVIPDETIDAALLETSSPLKIFRYILIPQIKHAIIVLFILMFCESWNMVEQALIFASENPDIMPLSVKLSELPSDVAFAGSAVYMFPIIILYFIFDETIEKGMESYKW